MVSKMKGKIQYIHYRLITALISLIFTIFIGNRPTVAPGLELLFLLPLSMMITGILFGDIFCLYKKNIALFIIYFILMLRYLVTPFMISFTGHTVSTLNPSSQGYRYAIIMMIIELFVVMISIKIIWKKVKDEEIKQNLQNNEFRLTWVGIVLLILISALLLLRGNISNVLENMSFFLDFKKTSDSVFTYDFELLMVIKTILFLGVSSWASKKYEISKSSLKFLIIFLVLLFAGLNFLLYDADQRTVIAELAIATASVLVVVFPKKRKTFISITIISVLSILSVNFMMGTLFYDKGIDFKWTTEVLELYTANVSTMAHSYDIYTYVKSGMTEFTLLSDFVRYFGLITYPGLRNIFYYFLNIPSTPELFQSTLLEGKAYIMTTAGFSIYHGTLAFGWIFDILTYIFMVKFIYKLHTKQKQTKNIGYVYVYSFLQILASLILINNLLLFFKGASSYILLVYLFIKINNFGIWLKLHKNHPKEDKTH